MRALAILLVMLLSACAVPPGGSILNPAPAEEPSPLEAVIALSKKIKSLCIEPEYATYFAKTFCTPSELSLAMMSDRTKITQAQKNALNALKKTFADGLRVLEKTFADGLRVLADKIEKP